MVETGVAVLSFAFDADEIREDPAMVVSAILRRAMAARPEARYSASEEI